MSKDIQPFEFEGVSMRFTHDGQIVCSDLAKALGYRDAEKLARTLDDDEKGTQIVGTPGGTQSVLVVNEAGFYRACLNRQTGYIKDDDVRAFVKRLQRWVTHEVLPSIRKRGGYLTPEATEAALTDPDFIIRLATDLKAERAKRAELELQAEADRPKVIFADAVAASHTSILVGDLAKLLRQNGVEVGAQRLFACLRRHGYLIRREGADWNMPTQRSMELGLFTVKETAITHSDGHVTISRTPKVTGKGQRYFVERFLDGRLTTERVAA